MNTWPDKRTLRVFLKAIDANNTKESSFLKSSKNIFLKKRKTRIERRN